MRNQANETFGRRGKLPRNIFTPRNIIVGAAFTTVAAFLVLDKNNSDIQSAPGAKIDIAESSLTPAEVPELTTGDSYRAYDAHASDDLSDTVYKIERIIAQLRSENPDEVEPRDFSGRDINGINSIHYNTKLALDMAISESYMLPAEERQPLIDQAQPLLSALDVNAETARSVVAQLVSNLELRCDMGILPPGMTCDKN